MDPLAPPQRGRPSPLLTRFDTTDQALGLLRDLRQTRMGKLGAEATLPEVGPAVRVWVRNDTGGTLLPLSVVRLGDPVISAADFPHRVAAAPVFQGLTPEGADDAFAIVEEGAPGGDAKLVRGVVLGTTVCDVDFSDADHEYAEPAAGVTVLASAESGPVRILKAYGSGTGLRRCVVLVDRSGSGAIAHDEVVYDAGYTLSASDTWLDTGLDVELPAAGTYRVSVSFVLLLAVSSVAHGAVSGRFWDETAAAEVADTEEFLGGTVAQNSGHFFHTFKRKTVTVEEPSTIRFEAKRHTGGGAVYTASSIQDNAVADYLKLG